MIWRALNVAEGLASARPAAAPANKGYGYYATDTGVLSRSDGATWFAVGGGAPSGSAGGVLDGSYPNPGLAAGVAGSGLAETSDVLSVNVDGSTLEINSDSLRVKALGITDSQVATANKDGTAGTPSLRTLGTGAAQAASGTDSRLSDSRAPNGSAGGDLTGTYPNPTLGTAGPGATGPIGSATVAPIITIDAKGRVTALSSATISGGGSGADISARVFHTVNQSVTPSGSFFTLAFDSERFDTDTIHDNSTFNSRLTCKTAGKYMIGANVNFATNATGGRGLSILLNGATIIAFTRVQAAATVASTDVQVMTLYNLAVNDYVEAQAIQHSGGALNVVAAANWSPEFWMAKVLG